MVGSTFGTIRKTQNEKPAILNLHSTFILRNVYRLIEQEDDFIQFALKPRLLQTLKSLKTQAAEHLKQDYRNQDRARRFDDICDFIDLIEKTNKDYGKQI